jgi:ADP-ribose pyrophosphatase YjhB (NUDIX family)
VCVRDGAVLLARGFDPADDTLIWSLPGGGMAHGEDPVDAVVREVEEETGYHVRIDALLTVDSRVAASHHVPQVDVHMLRIVYAATVIGGELRSEVGGSSDLAAWVALEEVPDLPRLPFVDVGLDLFLGRDPATR